MALVPNLSTVPRQSHQIFSLFLELPNVFSLEVIFACGRLKGKLILPLIRLLRDDHHGGLSDLTDKETNEKEGVSNFL